MKNFLDCLMAQSSLRVSMSHSYNQVDLDKHFKKQRIECLKSLPTQRIKFLPPEDTKRKAKRIFTTINLGNLDIKLLTHEDFYQYFLPELIQNSFVLGTTVLSGEKWVPVGFHRQGDTNILETGEVLLPLHSPLVFHYVLHYKDTLSNYYSIHFEINEDRVTLSPCKHGTGKIDLAHFKVTKGILYLVKQWLITKFVDHGTNLGVNMYSYLPEMCTIFTPLTEKLAIYLWEKLDDLSSANLVVQFLDDNVVNNYGKGTGELNTAFKHLQGRDFVQINEFNKSNNTYRVGWVTLTFNTTNDSKRGFIPPWDVQVDGGNVGKTSNLNEGRNNNSGSTVTGEYLKNKPNQSKESGIDTTKGNSKDTGLTDKTSKTCEKEGSNVREEKVIDWAKSPLNAVVTMPKFPVNLNGRQTTQPLEISVLLKDQDPEIMYPLYEVDEQVRYTERRNSPVLIGEVYRYLFNPYEQYESLPGNYITFKKGKAGEHNKWCPYFKVPV
eukprot:jgi/Psemu1/31860/gm1.31860_g